MKRSFEREGESVKVLPLGNVILKSDNGKLFDYVLMKYLYLNFCGIFCVCCCIIKVPYVMVCISERWNWWVCCIMKSVQDVIFLRGGGEGHLGFHVTTFYTALQNIAPVTTFRWNLTVRLAHYCGDSKLRNISYFKSLI